MDFFRETQMDQRTPEWFAERLGKVTASRMADVVAKTAKGYGASRANYMAELVVERLTGKPTEGFSNAAMQWGTDQEPFARDAYSAKTGELVTEVGFVNHPRIENAGASPDGIVGTGLVEIKCPNTASHIEYLMSKEPPQKYYYQMQWQIGCAMAEFCDWVSYDPRMPQELQLLIVRIYRDEDCIKMLEAEVETFLSELDAKVKALKEMKL
jgi:putative phage-type endonuclease